MEELTFTQREEKMGTNRKLRSILVYSVTMIISSPSHSSAHNNQSMKICTSNRFSNQNPSSLAFPFSFNLPRHAIRSATSKYFWITTIGSAIGAQLRLIQCRLFPTGGGLLPVYSDVVVNNQTKPD